jgi:hypothetical protein
MTTLLVASQIALTLAITSGVTVALLNYIVPPTDPVILKWYERIIGGSLVFHFIACPLALINIIWSF